MPFISNKRDCARCCNQYRCSNCPQQGFLDSCSLIKHLRKSLAHKRKDQTFDCTICNKTFALKTGYIHHLQHKRIHRYDLHQAACCGRYQDVSQLINSEYANVAGASHKSDTQLNYQLGATPMHCAAFKGYSRCLRIMLGWQDGDPNVVDEYGQTPVHIAARCGKASSLKLLLCKGGRLDVKDVKNKTPISLAQCHNHCMNVVIEYQLQRKILKYFETRIYGKKTKCSILLLTG